jgi:type I restriction enzyme R subunit
VALTHYRLQKQGEQDLKLREEAGERLKPGDDFGSGSSRNKEMEFLSHIVERMNDLFAADNLSEADLVSYARTIADKIQENESVMSQVTSNTPDQAMLGDFPNAVQEAVLASGDAHNELMTQFLSNKAVQLGFGKLILEMLTKSA